MCWCAPQTRGLPTYSVGVPGRCRRQDPREFSDDVSEDSGFEESVGATDRKREQRLENDKYDMALEVRPTTKRIANG